MITSTKKKTIKKEMEIFKCTLSKVVNAIDLPKTFSDLRSINQIIRTLYTRAGTIKGRPSSI
jgi:hypothetical protein